MIPVSTAFPLNWLLSAVATELHGVFAMEFWSQKISCKSTDTQPRVSGFVGAFNLVSQWLSDQMQSRLATAFGRKLRVQMQHLYKWSHQINWHQICFMSPIWAHEHMHLVDAKQLLSLCKTGKLCEALPPAHGGDAYLSPSWSGQNWSRYQGEE